MSKQRSVFALILACLVLLAACRSIQTTTGLGSPIEGSGNEASENRDVSGFSSVAVGGNGTLILEQTGEESLTITADDNILPLLESKVENGRLTLAGHAEHREIMAGGNHLFNGEKLAGSSGSAECSGNGVVTVNISDTLEAQTEGNCSVLYLGNPQVILSGDGTRNVAGR